MKGEEAQNSAAPLHEFHGESSVILNTAYSHAEFLRRGEQDKGHRHLLPHLLHRPTTVSCATHYKTHITQTGLNLFTLQCHPLTAKVACIVVDLPNLS